LTEIGQRRGRVTTIAIPGILKDSARSSKQSRDPVKTQTIRKILAGMVMAIRVARIIKESTGIIEQP
jgi:hypothetical protein